MYESKLYAAFIHASNIMFTDNAKAKVIKPPRKRLSSLFETPCSISRKPSPLKLVRIRRDYKNIKLLPIKLRPTLSKYIVAAQSNLSRTLTNPRSRSSSNGYLTPLGEAASFANTSTVSNASPYENHRVANKCMKYIRLKLR